MKLKGWRFFIATLFFIARVSFAQTPPANDDFENRIVLTGSSGTFTGTLRDATLQPGEPIAEGDFSTWPYLYYADEQNASVWWSWTADATEPVTIELLDSSTNELKLGGIDIWTGTDLSTDFSFVAGTSFNIGRHPFLTFSATNGTTYQLRVVGNNYGNFTLKITETNIPIIVVQPMSRAALTNDGVFLVLWQPAIRLRLQHLLINGVRTESISPAKHFQFLALII